MLVLLEGATRDVRTERPARFATDSFDREAQGARFVLEGVRLDDGTLDDVALGDASALLRTARGAYAFCMLDASGAATLGHDLLAKTPLYYYARDGLLLCGTSFFQLTDALRARGVPLTANAAAVGAMCRDGVFTGDQTYVGEVRYLPPYQYLTYRDGETAAHSLPLPIKRDVPVAEAVERLDALFAEACRLQYDKNARAGLPQVMTLSAGMDSRMVLAYLLRAMSAAGAPASDLTTLAFAQSGSMDATIAARIAKDFGCGHAFRPLDGGGFLLERDAPLAQNEGQMGYAGSTGAYGMLSEREGLGVVHTGLGGGELMGDVLLSDATDAQNDARNLGDMRVCLNFQRTTRRFCEACSPFLYEPFYEYALSLPTAMKRNRALYVAWYRAKVGWAYPTTYYRGAVGSRAGKLAGGLRMRLAAALGRRTRFDMNPFASWQRENPALDASLRDMLQADMAALQGVLDASVLAAAREAFEAGNLEQKAQALTATGALRRVLG